MRRGGVPHKSDAKVETANVGNVSSCESDGYQGKET